MGDSMDDLPLCRPWWSRPNGSALGRKRIGCPLLAPWTCELGKWIESPDSAQVVSLRGSENVTLDTMPGFIDSIRLWLLISADSDKSDKADISRFPIVWLCFVDILFCRLEWLDRQSFCGKVDPTGADFLSSLPKLAKLAVSRFQKLGPKHSPMAWFWHSSYIILPKKLKLQPRGKIWLSYFRVWNVVDFWWLCGILDLPIKATWHVQV